MRRWAATGPGRIVPDIMRQLAVPFGVRYGVAAVPATITLMISFPGPIPREQTHWSPRRRNSDLLLYIKSLGICQEIQVRFGLGLHDLIDANTRYERIVVGNLFSLLEARSIDD